MVLLLWVGWGLGLTMDENFLDGFKEMNSVLVRDWLLAPGQGLMHLKIWFVGLCLVMAVMGVNLVFCSWNRILKIMRHRFSGAKLFMLIVHIIFGLVALGHFGGFMLGYRYDAKLTNGRDFQFEGDYRLKLTDIHFVNDPEILKKSRREILRDEFQYEDNFAVVALYKGDRLLLQDTIYLLDPLHHGNIQITLRRFLPPKGGVSPGWPSGVMCTVSCNPVLKIFLWIYPLMILGIMAHLIMTWRQPEKVNNNKSEMQT